MMRLTVNLTLRLLACMMLCATVLIAQARDQREATVGMRAYVEQVVMAGPELVPAPSSMGSQVVVRVVKTWPHGEHLRYDLEWVGFEEGSYNLTNYLVHKDGTPMGALPPINVKVRSLLPAEAFEPSDIDPAAAARLPEPIGPRQVRARDSRRKGDQGRRRCRLELRRGDAR